VLFERKRVVQVMSRQGRPKRRMPRLPRRVGRSVLVVALHARVTRLLGRRRRRCHVRYSRERGSDSRGFRRFRRRSSRWPRRRRRGGSLFRRGRTAAKHAWVWPLGYGVRGGGAGPATVQLRGEVRGELFGTARPRRGQWCGQLSAESRVASKVREVASVFQPLASHSAAALFYPPALDISQPQQRRTVCDTLEGICRYLGAGKGARLSVRANSCSSLLTADKPHAFAA
jgi:hypothetical protein